jgi:hypothetical protein
LATFIYFPNQMFASPQITFLMVPFKLPFFATENGSTYHHHQFLGHPICNKFTTLEKLITERAEFWTGAVQKLLAGTWQTLDLEKRRESTLLSFVQDDICLLFHMLYILCFNANWAGSNQLEGSLSSTHQLDSQHLDEEYEDASDDDDDEGGFALDPFLEKDWLRREPTTAAKSQELPLQSPSNAAVPTLGSTAVPTLRLAAVPTLRPAAVPTLRPEAVPTLRPAAIPTLRPAAVAFSSRPPRLRFATEARWPENRLFNNVTHNDFWVFRDGTFAKFSQLWLACPSPAAKIY